jgi:site-specific DNA recombinase
MNQAVIYARVSTKEQQKEGFSIPSQLKLLHEYADKKCISIIKEFTESETAKKIGRTEFNNLIDYLKANKQIKIILVEKTDRLTRNFNDYVLIDQIVNELDIEVHLVKEGEVLSKYAKSHTKLIHSIKVALAKNFIDNLSEETSKGMLEKASQGFYPSKAPYGYKNNTQTKLIEADEQKSKIVQRAYELYASGLFSIQMIRDQLYREGFIFRNSTPKASVSSLHKILTNQFYTGYFIFKGVHRIGHHPPLISMSLFKEVQYQLKKLNKPDYSKREIAFAGLIKCGHCGNLITGDIKKGKYIYYRCTHSKQKCPDKYIREEKLDDQFASIVKSFSITKEQFEWMVKGLKEINKVKDCEVKERTKQITLEIEKWNLRLSKLYEDKLDEVIREDFYIQKSRDWNEKIADYQEQLTKLKQASKEQMELGLTILDFAKDAHSLYKKLEKFERVKFLKIIVSNSTLKNGILDVELKKPFDALVKIGQNERTYPQCA